MKASTLLSVTERLRAIAVEEELLESTSAQTDQEIRELADRLHALADPIRIRIAMYLKRAGASRIEDIMEGLFVVVGENEGTYQAIRRHVETMKLAGLVEELPKTTPHRYVLDITATVETAERIVSLIG